VVKWIGWTLVDTSDNEMVWKRLNQVIKWTRDVNQLPWVEVAEHITEKNRAVDIILKRLPNMGNSAHITAQVNNPNHQTLVLYCGKEIVATAVMETHAKEDFSECLFFAVDDSRKGSGTHLMNGLKTWVHHQGVHFLVLNACNTAIGFFEKQSLEKYEHKKHLASQQVTPRVLKSTNATLMVYDLTMDPKRPEFRTIREKDLVSRCAIGQQVHVRYGNQPHRAGKVSDRQFGTIQAIDGIKVQVHFNGSWHPEWIPVTSPRLTLSPHITGRDLIIPSPEPKGKRSRDSSPIPESGPKRRRISALCGVSHRPVLRGDRRAMKH
jgi:hypothetical protein